MDLWKSSVQVLCVLRGDEKLSEALLEMFFFFSVIPYFLVIFLC